LGRAPRLVDFAQGGDDTSIVDMGLQLKGKPDPTSTLRARFVLSDDIKADLDTAVEVFPILGLPRKSKANKMEKWCEASPGGSGGPKEVCQGLPWAFPGPQGALGGPPDRDCLDESL
jgi:hypothetical protein